MGDKVKPKIHTSKGASVPTIAVFAMFGRLLDRWGGDPCSSRRTTSLFATFVVLFAASSFTCAPAALAGEAYPPGPGTLFGSEGSGNGQFIEPAGVAVNDTTKDVYVVAKGNSRVEYFSSAGVYAGQFDGSATPAASFSEPHDIAVDNSG